MKREIWKKRLAVLLALVLVWNVFSDQLVSVQASKSGETVSEVNEIMATGSLEGGQEGFTVHSFEINLVEGQTRTPITDESEIYAGANVEVTFEWTLADSVRLENPDDWTGQVEFIIDTTSPDFKYCGLDIYGMEEGEKAGPWDLTPHDYAGSVGSYYIENGIIHIIINDKTFFQNEENRYGGVTFSGTVEKSDDNTEDGKPKTIEFGTESVTPTYYLSEEESSAQVSKATSGSLQRVGDKYYQTFTVTITAKDGTVTDIDLADSVYPAGMLTNPSDVKVTTSTVDDVAAQDYASLDEALAAIKAATFYKDETITLQYTMEVDASIYEQNAEWYKNTISGTYQPNRPESTPKNVSAEAGINVNKPSISKTGSSYQVRDGKGYVEWTITINLGDYYTGDGDDLADYLKSITDLPGTGLVANGQSIPLNPANFEQSASDPRVFVYKYETEVEQKVVDSTSDETVRNKVSMIMPDDNVYEGWEAGYTIPGAGPYVEKTIKEKIPSEDGLYVIWNIKIDGIPKSGITELSLHDDSRHYINNPGKQILLYEIYIDDVLVANADGIIDKNKIKEVKNWEYAEYGTIVFQDEYVNSVAAVDGAINVQVKTLITEDTIGKEYGNGANVSYKDVNTGSETNMPVSRATFQDTTNVLTKTGAVVSGEDAIDYTIKVILPPLNIQEPGKRFVIEDILPAGMKLSDTDVTVMLTDQWDNNQYVEIGHSAKQSEVSVAGSTEKQTQVTFEITATENWISKIKGYEGGSGYGYHLVIKYRAEVADRATFVKEGVKKEFTNSASGTYGGESIGSDSTTNELTPTQIVKKSAEYTADTAEADGTAPFIKYTVEVNTEALTLLDGTAKLQAVDTIGVALKFVDADYFTKESEKTYYRVQVIDVKAGTELTLGTDYTYTMAANRLKINFELPDSKHLRLIYWAYAAPGTKLTPENSTNSFKLSGTTSEALSDEHSFDMVAYTPWGWVGSEVGNIIIYKFWTDNEEQIALEGSVFRLVKVTADETTKTFIPGEVVHDNLRITEENRVGEEGSGMLKIEGLPVNQIFALYEIDADDGFALNKKPYYFVVPGSTAVSIPEWADVKEFKSGDTLEYENEKAATLVLEKTIEGAASQADIEGVITFTVKDSEGNLIGTYKPGDEGFTYANGKWTLTLNNLSAGTYTVEETVCDATGHEAVRVVYCVDAGAWSSAEDDAMDTSADVVVEAEETTTITFKNVYEGFTVPVSKVALTGGQAISGAKLRITGTQLDGTVIDAIEWTTDGTTKNVLLYPGSYVLEEVSAPVGYVKAANVSFTVSVDGTIIVDTNTVTNVVMEDEEISVKLSKVDEADNTVKLAGATIALYNASDIGSDGKPVAGATALATWSSTTGDPYDFGSKLETGKSYVFVELSAPNGYEIASNIEFTVNADGSFEVITTGVTVTDGVILMEDAAAAGTFGSIILTKTVAGVMDETELVGKVQFRVENADATTPEYNKTFALGEDGFLWNETAGKYVLTITNLPTGIYKVTEILGDSTPDNMTCTVTYLVNATPGTGTEAGSVAVGEDEEVAVDFTNTYAYVTGKLKVTKTFAEAGGNLTWADIASKISFSIYDENGDEVTGSPIAGTELELKNGVYESKELELPVGSYTVKETCIAIDNYEVSTTYVVTTGTAAGGSGSDAQAEDVAVQENATTVVAFTNTYSYTGEYPVPVSKIAFGGSEELAGAKLKITGTKASGGAIEPIEWTSGSASYEAKLYPGTYTLTETEAPAGYAKASSIEFTVEVDGTIKVNGSEADKVVMEDKPISFDVAKVNADGTASVVGAVLEIYLATDVTGDEPNAGATPVASWTSTNSSHVNFGSKLIAGQAYVLIEAYAPKGYAYIEPIAFTVADDGTITVNLDKDGDVYQVKDALFSVKFSKVDADDTSKKVAGADIKVYSAEDVNADGTVKDGATAVASWTSTDGEAYDFGSYLEAGKSYVFVETSAPSGYEVATNIAFTVEKDGTVEITSSGTETMVDGVILMKDKAVAVAPELGSLKLTKTVAGVLDRAELEGKLKFTVKNADDTTPEYNKTFTLGQDEFLWDATLGKYVLTIEDLPVGNYKVTEVLGDSTPDNMSCEVSYTVDTTPAQNGAGTIVTAAEVSKDTETTVAYTNTYAYITGKLKVTKTFTEATDTLTWDDIKNSITFKIYDETGSEIAESPISGADLTLNGTVYESEEIELPIGTYKVEEVLTTVTGYTVTTTYAIDVDGNAGASGSTAATGNIELGDGETVTIAYTNTYTKSETDPDPNPNPDPDPAPDPDPDPTPDSETGKLIITKTLKGKVDRAAAEKAITFTVTNNDTGEAKTYKLSDFTYNEATGLYTLELEYTAGGYTVEETVTNVDGYKLTKVTYTVNGDTKEGKTAEITVPADGTVTVAFEDTYKKKTSKPSDDDDDDDDDDEDPGVPPTPQTTSLTKTGDDTPLGLWMTLFGCGFAGLAAGCVALIRRRRQG